MAETENTGLNFSECGIAKTLNQYSLVVPLNQREYTWQTQVRTLLTDLTKAFDADEKIYFLGMIVLARGNKGQLEVADGQQRLATISIIIAAIRDYMLELKDINGAKEYERDYLLKYDPRTKGHTPKLQLNFEDREFFLKTILRPPSEREPYNGRSFNSHERLSAAMTLAREHVENMVAIYNEPEEKLKRLYDWMDFLKNNALVIIITVSAHVGNVFKMFETLNARGVPASQIDILKNYLFDKGKERISEIHPKWTSMVATIDSMGGDDLLVDFIRHYWIAHNGPTYQPDLGEKIESSIRGERQAVDLVSALESSSENYVALLIPREHPKWEGFSRQTRDCIHAITRELRLEQIRPLLLAITKYFSIPEAEKAFRLCLSWSVRFLIAGGAGGGVLDRNYGLRAMEISKKEIKTAQELSENMKSVVPNDEVFRVSFEIASAGRMHFVRYYLRAIELYLKEDPNPAFVPNEDPKAINIEHILPITPSTEWKIEPDIALSYYRRIGNMVLLDAMKNTKIGNKTFADKRQSYVDCPYLTTKEIVKYKKWGPKEITERQKGLANIAIKVWPL